VRDEVFAPLDVDCLSLCEVACPRESGKWPCPWTTQADRDAGVDCLDAADCCGVADCPASREFPDCSNDFGFSTSTREVAYWLRVLAPRANCFLLNSDFFLLSWIRDLGNVAEQLDFPGDECSQPEFDSDKRWRWCAKRNLALLGVPATLLLLAYAVAVGGLALLLAAALVLFRLGIWAARATGRAARSAATSPGFEPPTVAETRRFFAAARKRAPTLGRSKEE